MRDVVSKEVCLEGGTDYRKELVHYRIRVYRGGVYRRSKRAQICLFD